MKARPMPLPMREEEFWANVDQSGGPDACWPWLACRSKSGYGQFVPGNKQRVPSHRYALYLSGDRRQPGPLLACHRCDNPPCCNPAHLFWGTASDNMRDAYAKGRKKSYIVGTSPLIARKFDTHCKNGHEWNEESTYRKPNGMRSCRLCARDRDRVRHEKRKLERREQKWQGKPRTPIGRGARPKKIGRRGKRLEASWQACRAQVITRSGGACEGPDLPGIHPSHAHGATDVHHLFPEDRAAGVHDPDRCLHLCRPLHAWIDDEPRRAHELGLLRPEPPACASQGTLESDSLWPMPTIKGRTE